MKRMKLKNKLILGSLAMVIFVMGASAVVVSTLVNKQNRGAANDQIAKSLNVIRDELAGKQERLLKDVRQTTTFNKMGSKVKYLYEFKKDMDRKTAGNTCEAITNGLFNIAISGQLREVLIYDIDGDLTAFAVKSGKDEYLAGFGYYKPQRTFRYVVRQVGKELQSDAWRDGASLPDGNITTKFEGTAPEVEKTVFAQKGKALNLLAYAPIVGNVFNEKTEKLEKKPFGFAIAVRELDQNFVEHMSGLTGMKLNLFTTSGLSIGQLKGYERLKIKEMSQTQKIYDLAKQNVFIENLDAEEGSYFQGVLPFYNQSKYVGAVSVLLSQKTALASTWKMIRLLGLVYLGCILLIIPCAIIFSRSLSGPITRTIRVLTETAHEVSDASEQVSASSGQLAEGASEQAASIEESSSSLEEMAAMTKQNAQNAGQADELTRETNRVVGMAGNSMKQLTTSMGEISESSEKTSRIVKTIDEIAFQTNLLALNAAVEAARAGESGAGFAVVADEVRNLAMRAAEAAKNTSGLIKDTVEKIEGGTGLVNQTAQAFSEVTDNAGKVGQLTKEIASASNEQATGIDYLSQGVAEMENVVQRNTASAEETASASHILSEQADQMRNIVEELVTFIGANTNGNGHEPEPRPHDLPETKRGFFKGITGLIGRTEQG